MRWMLRVSLKDERPSEELRQRIGIENIRDIVRRGRLLWYGHVQRKEEEDWVKKITQLDMPGRRPAGRPRKSWQEGVTADIRHYAYPQSSDRPPKMKAGHKRDDVQPGSTGRRTIDQ